MPIDTQRSQGFVGRHASAPYVLVTFTVLFFAGNTVVGRAIYQDIPPMALVFWRSSVALVLLAPFLLASYRRHWRLIVKHWKLMMVLGLTQVVLGQGLIYLGLHTTTAINAGVLQATQPILIIVIAWLVLREAIRPRQAAGIVLALLGVLAIATRGRLDALLGLDLVVGDLWVLLAFVSWAVYTVAVKRAPPGLDPFIVFHAMTLAAFVVLVPLYVGELVMTEARFVVTPAAVSGILYTAVFASILALAFLHISVAHIGPAKAGGFFYLMPVFTVGLALLLLGEPLRLYHVAGTALVFGGVFLSIRQPARAAMTESEHGGTAA